MTPPSPWLDHPPYGLADHVIDRLAAVAEQVAAEWRVQLGPRIASGRYSYVAWAGDDAVLKVTPEEDEQTEHVIDALQFWQGDGAVRLLRHDRERRALLLERVRPGTEAADVSEEDALAAAVAAGQRIWRSPGAGHPFRAVEDLVRRWLAEAGSHALVAAARTTFEAIRRPRDVLVHVDFHHHNLLLRGTDWVTIDPQPYIGEPEFDVPAFLWNPLSTTPTRQRTERRIRAFADAGLDADRIRAWAIVRGVCNGLPLRAYESEDDSPQLRVARSLL